jgi:hypothetical protein
VRSPQTSRSAVRIGGVGVAIVAITWYMPYPVRAWWQWVGGPAMAMLASAAIALWTQMPPSTSTRRAPLSA